MCVACALPARLPSMQLLARPLCIHLLATCMCSKAAARSVGSRLVPEAARVVVGCGHLPPDYDLASFQPLMVRHCCFSRVCECAETTALTAARRRRSHLERVHCQQGAWASCMCPVLLLQEIGFPSWPEDLPALDPGVNEAQQRLAAAGSMRETGNAAFHAADWQTAASAYSQALR